MVVNPKFWLYTPNWRKFWQGVLDRGWWGVYPVVPAWWPGVVGRRTGMDIDIVMQHDVDDVDHDPEEAT
jgi:hypothetical protein